MKIRARSVIAFALAGTAMYTAAIARESAQAPGQANLSATNTLETAIQPGIQIETLLKADSSRQSTSYSAHPLGRTVVRLAVPPHTALSWQNHPLPNAAYVVSGQIAVEKQGDTLTQTLGAGQLLAEMAHTPHRGLTGDEPAVLMVFYAGAQGRPLYK